MRQVLVSSALVLLSAAGGDAAGRLGQPQQESRELQSPSTIVLNALIDTFLPAVVNDLENNIAQDLDPVALDFETKEAVEVTVAANDTICPSNNTTDGATAVSRSGGSDDGSYTGEISYYIEQMAGMGTMDVESVELKDGTQDINIPFASFFGAQGSTWSGVWDAVANFDQFVLSTTATLNMTSFCNMSSYTEVETGTFTIVKPKVTMTIYVYGETGNIYRFNDESVVTVATVQSLSMTYETVTGNLGYFDDYAVVDADEPFITKVEEEFTAGSEFFTLLTAFVQEEVDKEMPFSL
ncbi:expressed unknown protein [Seminavis robusta]|uniref:Uncharacterized protein n=1 Tax=Seminavis robusta TaxID=568900 RepID=A0A9N8HLI7_9STRA|nr:expressed unknown protein [Seminavis robusta]|eukprot:Sro1034_g233830.1 n/a (296) ;mRNA; f:16992-17879